MPCYVHWGIVKVALAKAQQISNVFRFDDVTQLTMSCGGLHNCRSVDQFMQELDADGHLVLTMSISALMKIYENVVKDGKHNVNI